jgi:hypothetical protein
MPNQFPSGKQAFQWFPMVGIATDSVGAGALYNLLIQFLGSQASQPLLDYFFSVRLDAFGDLVFDDHINELNPNRSDLIVFEGSQRNGIDVPVTYFWHPHIAVQVTGLLGETESPVMATHIRNLLSSPLNGITLPAFPDFVPNQINDASFFELGQGD